MNIDDVFCNVGNKIKQQAKKGYKRALIGSFLMLLLGVILFVSFLISAINNGSDSVLLAFVCLGGCILAAILWPLIALFYCRLFYGYGDIIENIELIREHFVGESAETFKSEKNVLLQSEVSKAKKETSWARNIKQKILARKRVKIKACAFKGRLDITSVSVPVGVKSIEQAAFEGCENLTTVIMPNTVKKIGHYAFKDCRNLKNVYYYGDRKDLGRVLIGSYNSFFTSATFYYYSETEPTQSGNFWHYDADGNPVAW